LVVGFVDLLLAVLSLDTNARELGSFLQCFRERGSELPEVRVHHGVRDGSVNTRTFLPGHLVELLSGGRNITNDRAEPDRVLTYFSHTCMIGLGLVIYGSCSSGLP